MSPRWKPESRILNTAFTVYSLLNQRTQIAQIVIHKMYTYAFIDQNSAVIVFLQILMWALSKIQGKKQFAKFRMLRIEEGKHVYYIYTFVTLTFRTEVILVCRWKIQ